MFAFANASAKSSEALGMLSIDCEGGFEGPSMGPSFAGPRFSTEQKTDPRYIWRGGTFFIYDIYHICANITKA